MSPDTRESLQSAGLRLDVLDSAIAAWRAHRLIPGEGENSPGPPNETDPGWREMQLARVAAHATPVLPLSRELTPGCDVRVAASGLATGHGLFGLDVRAAARVARLPARSGARAEPGGSWWPLHIR
jgi:hypothetical protein